MRKIKAAIIREGKIPQDTRTPLIPKHIRELMEKYPNLEFKIENSPIRCYTDEEFEKLELNITDDIDDCELFLGVKEVPFHLLFAGKTYMFFSHTIKKQAHNRNMLREIIRKKIRLIDYELLTDSRGVRLIGFGHWAGIVGAHYALLMWGKRKDIFDIKPAVLCKDYKEMVKQYDGLFFDNPKIVITGSGRVGKGAVEIMEAANIRRVTPEEFVNLSFDEAVYTQIDVDRIYQRTDGEAFDFHYFVDCPREHQQVFKPFWQNADILINCLYWDPRSSRLFEIEDVKSRKFKIGVIADISCDINGSVPTTHRASAISDPIFGYDKRSMEETFPYMDHTIDMMTVDNLPNELPRDASKSFSDAMSNIILPLYIENPHHEVLDRATITENGYLKPAFSYLQHFVDDVE